MLKNQKGIVQPLVILAVIGILAFLVASQSFSFKNSFFSKIFPKPPSFASTSFSPKVLLLIYNPVILANSYQVDLSTTSDMSTDVYLTFTQGLSSPITETNPTKWGKYQCGTTLYWRVYPLIGQTRGNPSPIQTSTVCPSGSQTQSLYSGQFTNLSADLEATSATFNFTYSAQKLSQYAGWYDPDTISQQLITDMSQASHGRVNFNIAQRVEINGIPTKADGFQYNNQSYLSCLASNGANCHSPDTANYDAMLSTVNACGLLNSGQINEVWIWGGPWFGYWESNLAGPGAFWYNSLPTYGTTCNSLLPIMGFNYQRDESQALHSFGHRIESTMSEVYGEFTNPYGGANWNGNSAWDKFARLDKDSPGNSGCGNTHFPPNGQSDYDYGDTKTVATSCLDFLNNYPNLTGQTTQVNCSVWNCDEHDYHMWNYLSLPHGDGIGPDGKLNDWWAYFADPQDNILNSPLPTSNPTPAPSPTPSSSPGPFDNLSASFDSTSGTFNFHYLGSIPWLYQIQLSLNPNMSPIFRSFNWYQNYPLPVIQYLADYYNYKCGTTLYWKIFAFYQNGAQSAPSTIQTGTVVCSTPTPTPTPTPAPPPSYTLEGENMSTTYAGSVFSDPTASGGEALIIKSNDTASGTLTTQKNVSTIIVKAEGDQCNGAPLMDASVDGLTVLSTTVSATSWQNYSFTSSQSLSPGTHKLAISYINDYYNGVCDRNLKIDSITLK